MPWTSEGTLLYTMQLNRETRGWSAVSSRGMKRYEYRREPVDIKPIRTTYPVQPQPKNSNFGRGLLCLPKKNTSAGVHLMAYHSLGPNDTDMHEVNLACQQVLCTIKQAIDHLAETTTTHNIINQQHGHADGEEGVREAHLSSTPAKRCFPVFSSRNHFTFFGQSTFLPMGHKKTNCRFCLANNIPMVTSEKTIAHGRTQHRSRGRETGLEVPLRTDPVRCLLSRTYKTTTAEHPCIWRVFAATRESCGRFSKQERLQMCSTNAENLPRSVEVEAICRWLWLVRLRAGTVAAVEFPRLSPS